MACLFDCISADLEERLVCRGIFPLRAFLPLNEIKVNKEDNSTSRMILLLVYLYVHIMSVSVTRTSCVKKKELTVVQSLFSPHKKYLSILHNNLDFFFPFILYPAMNFFRLENSVNKALGGRDTKSLNKPSVLFECPRFAIEREFCASKFFYCFINLNHQSWHASCH